jgi:hypothetical protein
MFTVDRRDRERALARDKGEEPDARKIGLADKGRQ